MADTIRWLTSQEAADRACCGRGTLRRAVRSGSLRATRVRGELRFLGHWVSAEFVRQTVQYEPGVTEWVRQNPGRSRYRVLRIPQSVAERICRMAVAKASDQ